MRDWLSTGAARAWFGVALAGLVVIALVIALMLIPRLGAGQQLPSAPRPGFPGGGGGSAAARPRRAGVHRCARGRHEGRRARALAVRRRRRSAADAARRRR